MYCRRHICLPHVHKRRDHIRFGSTAWSRVCFHWTTCKIQCRQLPVNWTSSPLCGSEVFPVLQGHSRFHLALKAFHFLADKCWLLVVLMFELPLWILVVYRLPIWQISPPCTLDFWWYLQHRPSAPCHGAPPYNSIPDFWFHQTVIAAWKRSEIETVRSCHPIKHILYQQEHRFSPACVQRPCWSM